MSLESEISQLTKAIEQLNTNFECFFNQQSAPTPTPTPTAAPVEPESVNLLPDVAKTMTRTREQLQSLCLEATKRNAANRDIIKAIMLNNFVARKTSDLADNQIDMCYAMIVEATKD